MAKANLVVTATIRDHANNSLHTVVKNVRGRHEAIEMADAMAQLMAGVNFGFTAEHFTARTESLGWSSKCNRYDVEIRRQK